MQKLTATAVKQAKTKSEAYKLSDGGSLYLLVNSQGKYWRYDYRFADKRKTLAIGVYPDVSLKAARDKHQDARENLTNGIDPNTQKQAERAAQKNALANSFEVIALEWLKTRGVKSEGGDKRLNRLLQKDLFPYIGKPITVTKDMCDFNGHMNVNFIKEVFEQGWEFTIRDFGFNDEYFNSGFSLSLIHI